MCFYLYIDENCKINLWPFQFCIFNFKMSFEKKKLHRTVINCFGILLYFLSTKPWHQRLPKYHAVSWLPRVVIWWQISCSDSFWVTKISLSTLSSQCLDSGIHSPAMPWCTSLATFFKTWSACSKCCFRKLVICKKKNPHDSPSWRVSSVLHGLFFFPLQFHALASAHSTNHTYTNGA